MSQALKSLKFMAFDVDGVMTDGTLTYLPDGSETKTFYTLDGAGIHMLQKSGIVVGWITGRSSPAVEYRAKNLGITHLAQGVSNKHKVFSTWLKEAGLDFPQAGFMGDDLIDLAVMKACAFSAAPANAVGIVKQTADLVTVECGGRGAVRAVCEHILQAQDKLDAFLTSGIH
ncbi:MAG: 3-deoxy-D-manno-octulosonate 8-phosphate phosphatase [Fluviibacter phosphoraccumulans EoVTN8]